MLNADTSIAAVVHSSATDWQSSPSSAVNRKRFHLVGEAESGQVICEVFDRVCEGFVLTGSINVNGADLRQHDWFRFPDGENVRLLSQDCSLYLKLGRVSQLSSYP